MEIKVGDKFRWPSDPFDVATVTKVEGTKFWYTCDNDNYKGESNFSYLPNNVFNEANQIVEEGGQSEEVSAITPSHYNSTKIDALSVIDDWSLNFRLGNTIKYIQRHNHKGKPLEDLEKAYQYLGLEIKRLKDDQTK